ncbi:hypothetical protein LCGC14_0789660 [marine sediment metagenome]|uniref:Uncharacterized protein n=1 Tax=marine sediment metagenome TaxID=412755 RepID=A0A0F9QCV8_9ZZZZ
MSKNNLRLFRFFSVSYLEKIRELLNEIAF